MTLSRTVAGLLAGFAASSAAAQAPIDYRLAPSPDPPLRTAIRPGCPSPTANEEIVVCGTRDRDERYRVPPSVRAPSAAHRAGGEQMAALAEGPGRCSTIGPNQQCTKGLDVIGIISTLARAVARARANRD